MYNKIMKRLNPITNQPFKFGDIREDGKKFTGYQAEKGPSKSTGYFYESWVKPESFELKKKLKYKSMLKHRVENHKQYRKSANIWASKNRFKMNAKLAKYNASKLQRTPKWLTESDLRMIEAKYSLAAMLTRETGITHHVDHIIPLQGKKVSGLHVFSNLRVIPGTDNVKKSNSYQI
jgi:hypothetical protein